MTVVAHHGDSQRLAARERHDRVEHLQTTAEQVERELWSGDIGDHQVEEALAGLQARSLAEDRGRREPGKIDQHLGAHGLARLLEVVHRPRDLPQAGHGILLPNGQWGPHRGNLIA